MSDFELVLRTLVRQEVDKALAAQPKSPVAPEHITVAEFAKRRSISTSTVRKAIRAGRLAAIRIGRSVRVPINATIGRTASERHARDVARERRAAKLLGSSTSP